jgi:hypothetical protein
MASCSSSGIEISQATVAKYMVRRRGTPPSHNWRIFLRTLAQGVAAIDIFVVASASFRLLYVMIILAHDRRRVAVKRCEFGSRAGLTPKRALEAAILSDSSWRFGSRACPSLVGPNQIVRVLPYSARLSVEFLRVDANLKRCIT